MLVTCVRSPEYPGLLQVQGSRVPREGDAEIQAHADALAALITAHPAETDAAASRTAKVRLRDTSHSASG